MSLVSQPVLPLTPPGAVGIGPIAVLRDDGVRWSTLTVWPRFVSTPAMRWGAGWRRCSWSETEIAAPSQVASGFGVTRDTLWRWPTVPSTTSR